MGNSHLNKDLRQINNNIMKIGHEHGDDPTYKTYLVRNAIEKTYITGAINYQTELLDWTQFPTNINKIDSASFNLYPFINGLDISSEKRKNYIERYNDNGEKEWYEEPNVFFGPIEYWKINKLLLGLSKNESGSQSGTAGDPHIIHLGFCGDPRIIGYPIYISVNSKLIPIYIGKTGMYELMTETFKNINIVGAEEENSSMIDSIDCIYIPRYINKIADQRVDTTWEYDLNPEFRFVLDILVETAIDMEF